MNFGHTCADAKAKDRGPPWTVEGRDDLQSHGGRCLQVSLPSAGFRIDFLLPWCGDGKLPQKLGSDSLGSRK
jgi:hypothetical protein